MGRAMDDALRREILEELNTGISNTRRIFHTAHAYAERTVELHFYRGELTASRSRCSDRSFAGLRARNFAIWSFRRPTRS